MDIGQISGGIGQLPGCFFKFLDWAAEEWLWRYDDKLLVFSIAVGCYFGLFLRSSPFFTASSTIISLIARLASPC